MKITIRNADQLKVHQNVWFIDKKARCEENPIREGVFLDTFEEQLEIGEEGGWIFLDEVFTSEAEARAEEISELNREIVELECKIDEMTETLEGKKRRLGELKNEKAGNES